MHRAGIKPSVPGVDTSLVITFQQIWLMPMPAVYKSATMAPWASPQLPCQILELTPVSSPARPQ